MGKALYGVEMIIKNSMNSNDMTLRQKLMKINAGKSLGKKNRSTKKIANLMGLTTKQVGTTSSPSEKK